MTADEFVPVGFDPPTSPTTDQFHEPLGPKHNRADHAAWMSSIEHIRSTPGYPGGNWPPPSGTTLEENLADLRRHANDFTQGAGFTFTVLDPGDDDVIGCVCLYPSAYEVWDVAVQSWVRADRSGLDMPLAAAVAGSDGSPPGPHTDCRNERALLALARTTLQNRLESREFGLNRPQQFVEESVAHLERLCDGHEEVRPAPVGNYPRWHPRGLHGLVAELMVDDARAGIGEDAEFGRSVGRPQLPPPRLITRFDGQHVDDGPTRPIHGVGQKRMHFGGWSVNGH
ncbi:MAG TPA: hypothetical protein VFI30_00160 [Nocardioidaceae bacterium]|nr:hypothetical protein [Nocardioidaceae bacterium]